MHSLSSDFAECVRLLVCREIQRKPILSRRLQLLEPQATPTHIPGDTATPPAPGAIQIGPLDVS